MRPRRAMSKVKPTASPRWRMENVPGTHSADADPRLLTVDGYLREVDPR